jgi:hypothetical protein
MTGFIPLVYRVAKANIDVKAANRQGLYILFIVSIIASLTVIVSLFKRNCLYLTTIWTVMDKDRISINIIKFDEITVTFQPNIDTQPIIAISEAKQLEMHVSIHNGFLKTIYRTIKIKISAPMPKIMISFRTNVIVSSAIIETPPR